MNILVVGSGGREHALCHAIAASPLVTKLWCAPGNAGIAAVAACVAIDVMDFDRLIAFARETAIDFVVVAPDNPLAGGLVDRLTEAGIAAFGPTRAAAQLEWSKGFTKDLCAAEGIPTARYRRFTDKDAARAYAADHPLPVVIKADGLALGKGVVIATTRSEALAALDSMFDGAFGASGREVVIEEFLHGEEVSYFALSDGVHVLPFGSAQDHKRAGDGDTGPNTGGMGAIAPARVLSPALEARVLDEIVRPTVAAMAKRGAPFKGVLYAGLMLTDEGPKLIEYNARFGDPECQVLMLRLQSDLVPLLRACAAGGLATLEARWSDATAITVVMAAKGYPASPQKGTPIRGVEAAAALPGVTMFHAGTARDAAGGLIANGGRVLNVCAIGRDAREAQARAYAAVDALDWPGGFCRRDIGARAVARESGS